MKGLPTLQFATQVNQRRVNKKRVGLVRSCVRPWRAIHALPTLYPTVTKNETFKALGPLALGTHPFRHVPRSRCVSPTFHSVSANFLASSRLDFEFRRARLCQWCDEFPADGGAIRLFRRLCSLVGTVKGEETLRGRWNALEGQGHNRPRCCYYGIRGDET